jgi:Lipocalin-like domain
VEFALDPAFMGTDRKRNFVFAGDELTLTFVPPSDPANPILLRTIVWKRVH